MRFFDKVVIKVQGGKGGDGCTSFRREKFVPFGGPDGGHGGRGGHIYLQGDPSLESLRSLRGRTLYKGGPGAHGGQGQRHGRSGRDGLLKVPLGTWFRGPSHPLREISTSEKILMARGGDGGLGNTHFKSSTNRSPEMSTKGKAGEEVSLVLELFPKAAVALIGLPNAGKSTCLSVLSAATPKMGDYPFTTLGFHLGVVTSSAASYTVLDMPGLVTGASRGKGLGTPFLKAIEGVDILLHLVDISGDLTLAQAFDRYTAVRGELNAPLLHKKEILCLSKIDTLSSRDLERSVAFFEKHVGRRVFPFSSLSGQNIGPLKDLIQDALALEKCP